MARQATRTARLREIEELLLLAPEGLSAVDIAEKLSVDRRTVYRDLDFLQEQGVPLWQQTGAFGVDRTRYMANLRLSFHEAMALVLAGLLLARMTTERNPHISSALRKLAAVLPQPMTAHLSRAAERVQRREDGLHRVQVLETLTDAWGRGRKVRIGYRAAGKGAVRERVVAPYALEPTANGIYVIGYDESVHEIRTFKFDRLETAVVLEEAYTPPAGFDAEAHLATSWGIMTGASVTAVALQFAPAVTALVRERRWHPSQHLQSTAEGGVVLRVRVSEPLEMQPWIRSWGSQVRVLEPDWLRERIAADLKAAAAQYNPAG